MTENAGWILYDGACGFCRRWVPFWEGTLRRRGFAIAPLQAPWVQEKLEGIEGDPLDDIHLLLVTGELLSGADVYRYAMRRIWWTYPLYVLSIFPALRIVFDASYRWFAKHRYEVSEACALPGDTVG